MPPLPLGHDYIEGLNAEWRTLAAPGTSWTGAERVALAGHARAAREGGRAPDDAALPAGAAEAAARIAAAPHVDATWLGGLLDAGLSPEAYVEIIGIVGRVSAVDSLMFGVGAQPQPLPVPIDGEPSRATAEGASMNGALAPTVGPPGAPSALSAVPAEVDAMFALHGVLYLSLEEMADPTIEKTLTRAQMELIAARTSLLNDCFY
ncbi:MAG: hypothetical protein AAF480_00660 [Actinomycetota bacterium]